MRAFLFPGQGSQAVGMGAALAEASRAARDVFSEVDEALGQNLFRLMREGPDDELRLTENAQPAIMANSIAVFAALTKEGGVDLAKAADFVAGLPSAVPASAGRSDTRCNSKYTSSVVANRSWATAVTGPKLSRATDPL